MIAWIGLICFILIGFILYKILRKISNSYGHALLESFSIVGLVFATCLTIVQIVMMIGAPIENNRKVTAIVEEPEGYYVYVEGGDSYLEKVTDPKWKDSGTLEAKAKVLYVEYTLPKDKVKIDGRIP